jgi:hypothetical protein
MTLRNAVHTSIALAALALPGAAVFGASPKADDATTSRDASIPFANRGGIKDWHADRDRGLWVQDVHGKWYYAKLMSPCIGLNFANSIGFDTRPNGNFDRWSAIVVPRSGRCVVQTFTPSGPPPTQQKVASAEQAKEKG